MLGGIASFTLVDKDTVKPRDLGNNFMLRTADFGESKAKAIAAHLKELNASVVGSSSMKTQMTSCRRTPTSFMISLS